MNETTTNEGGQKVNDKKYISYKVGGKEFRRSDKYGDCSYVTSDDYALAGESAYFLISEAFGQKFQAWIEVVAVLVEPATDEKAQHETIIGSKKYHGIYGLDY